MRHPTSSQIMIAILTKTPPFPFQDHELHLATNCLGPFLFTKLLQPMLAHTAARSAPNSVRVSWSGSIVIDLYAPTHGVPVATEPRGEPDLAAHLQNPRTLYAISKAGNLFYASEFGRRFGDTGVVSTCFNPGNLKTELQRHVSPGERRLQRLLLFPPVLGAYTELWSGLAPDLTTRDNGAYIGPWGRIMTVKQDRLDALTSRDHGGSGGAENFWDWSEKQVQKFT